MTILRPALLNLLIALLFAACGTGGGTGASSSGGTTAGATSSGTSGGTTSGTTSGGCTWDSSQANAFYQNSCNTCHLHNWTSQSGCDNSGIPSDISGGYMPPGGGLSASDQSNILQYINCGCPQ